MRKVLIVHASAEIAKLFVTGNLILPPGVVCTRTREHFDEDILDIRLEGDGLPDSCRVPEAAKYRSGTFQVVSQDQPVTIQVLE